MLQPRNQMALTTRRLETRIQSKSDSIISFSPMALRVSFASSSKINKNMTNAALLQRINPQYSCNWMFRLHKFCCHYCRVNKAIQTLHTLLMMTAESMTSSLQESKWLCFPLEAIFVSYLLCFIATLHNREYMCKKLCLQRINYSNQIIMLSMF